MLSGINVAEFWCDTVHGC